MVISQPTRNNPSYYYRAFNNAASIALNASRDTLCSIHAITNIRVTHRNGAIKHIFYTNQIHGGIISRLFFIHFVAPCACSSSSGCNITSNLSVWRFEHVGLAGIHSSVVFPSRMPAGPHFVMQPILLSENIPNIWHVNHQQTQGGQTRLKR